MKFCIILLIVCIQFISCCLLNVTNDLFSDYPYSLFRRKRDINEYTRWRANIENTPEFVVKVLDEDLTTSAAKKIVAVNIESLAEPGEKIIIGGALVPKPTTSSTSLGVPNDYTRFMPPSAVPAINNGEMYLAPLTLPPVDNPIDPIIPPNKNADRDESPPADPKFLPRSDIEAQYAPIMPVGFTRRATNFAPLTPSTEGPYTPARTTIQSTITRTSLENVFWRSQTKSNGDDSSAEATRTTILLNKPSPTSLKFVPPLEQTQDYSTMKNDFNNNQFQNYPKEIDSYSLSLDYDDVNDKNRKLDSMLEDIYSDRNKYNDISIDETFMKKPSDTSKVILENTTQSEVKLKNESSSYSTTTEPTTTSEPIPKTERYLTRKKDQKVCSLLKMRRLTFNSPRTLPEIVAQMKKWTEVSPVAKWVDITFGNLTTMENPIYMMIVDDPSSGQIVSAKQTVMIVAGIQGRDHHAVASAMYVLFQLIEKTDDHGDLLSKYRFWVIPVFNPDGYDYSMTFPLRREWTKNLHQTWDTCKGREACQLCKKSGILCTIKPCYGVNLDRNFEYQWISAAELRSEHPCGSLYAGPRQLSEPETKAFTNFLHTKLKQLHTFIAIKEGPTLGVMYPYSHTKKRRPHYEIIKRRAKRASEAARSISGRPYVAGQTSEFLPLYAGGIEDWVESHLGIDNTYTIMMFRPTDFYSSVQITERVVHEAYAAMDTLLLQSVEPLVAAKHHSASVVVKKSKNSAEQLSQYSVFLTCSYITLHLIRLSSG